MYFSLPVSQPTQLIGSSSAGAREGAASAVASEVGTAGAMSVAVSSEGGTAGTMSATVSSDDGTARAMSAAISAEGGTAGAMSAAVSSESRDRRGDVGSVANGSERGYCFPSLPRRRDRGRDVGSGLFRSRDRGGDVGSVANGSRRGDCFLPHRVIEVWVRQALVGPVDLCKW